MRIFIFKSVSPDLGAFSGDLAGLKLPSRFKPWRVVGAVAPDKDPPYKLSRGATFPPQQEGLTTAPAFLAAWSGQQ
jgi:hypothetical protein